MRTEAKDAVRTRVLAQLAEENCCDRDPVFARRYFHDQPPDGLQVCGLAQSDLLWGETRERRAFVGMAPSPVPVSESPGGSSGPTGCSAAATSS
jgi:hypothetical protein